MIEFTSAFKTSTGQMVHDLKTAKVLELIALLKLDGSKLAELMVEKSEAVVDILTTKTTSRPRARRVNGGTRTRTRKPKATASIEDVVAASRAASPKPAPAPIMDEEDAAAASRTAGSMVENED